MDELLPFQISVVDAEFDDLAANRIYCIVVRDVFNPNLVKKFVNLQEAKSAGVEIQPDWLPINDYVEFSKAIRTFVAHNGITFDFPCIEKFLKVKPLLTQILDTLVLSRLLEPYRENGHSLDSWGAKLGYIKTAIEDFSKFTREIVDDRCTGDTEINVKLYHSLIADQKRLGFSEMSVRLEHAVQEIIHGQEVHGFYLDRQKAHKLLTDTQTRLNEIENEMVSVFCPQPVLIKVAQPKWKKDGGGLSAVGMSKAKAYFTSVGQDYTDHVKGPIALFELEDFNLGSPPQVKERLMEIGWKPLNLTPKGAPKIDEESLLPFAEQFPQVKLLSEYLTVRARNGLASQWLELCDKHGYVHGRCFTLGAITGRMTHQNPNMANVPKADPSVLYGKECRGCWTVEDPVNYRIVGCDAASLELRMLCHYMDDAEYTKEVIGGDIHTKNQKAAGLPSRNDAKTFIYALLYGAGDGKIGKIIGKGTKEGRALKERFFTAIPKLRKLFLDIGQQAKYHGFVTGLDGRKIWTRSEHAALNTLLQGGGAIVCKLWTVFIHKLAREQNLRFQQLVAVHDEYQFQVHKDDVEAFGAVTKAAMKEVEKFLKMKCPLDSTWQMGYNWSDTH